jgi:hypothetical protein
MDRQTVITPRILAFSLLAALSAAGCGSSREQTKQQPEQPAAQDLAVFEQDFRPSDHDPRPQQQPQTTGDRVPDSLAVPLETPAEESGEVVSGFRVQVLSTASIDLARSRKGELETAYPGEWFYLVYDPPTYKIRAGNFLTRMDADRFQQELSEQGYSGAWVVPERVTPNPPKRPAPQQPPSEQLPPR